ncbi:Co-chaperone HscB, C-terminal oligomerization domain-containing protein [Thamnocephalis sphaerospora]|uniref:Co-chaperone HscB, C-terminal oligomerization domain-containing protein n=1 Tax=Thamnocephalis sphaerospora TaxID=78915 RepID=A0A4V1IWL4_9FUNG|nr:Co-chaperone HscB, C-terminal oligomerization domain-containing protein [Thamnocephalis sphaerospora]|eukprot:RKP07969.1 Co-chaperone HscB, C-terminal oligomerization domain-containing protein [Thamnocephalis sphaerospora]
MQPVQPGSTYFDALGVSDQPTFDVDVKELRRMFLRSQQRVHPDTYATGEDRERQLAEQQSAWLNRAYHTLREPLARAQYLLQLHGVDVTETESVADPELLMTVMEERERIDDATDATEVRDVFQANEDRIRETITMLGDAFRANNWISAHALTVRLKYWYRLRAAVRTWEDEHGGK